MKPVSKSKPRSRAKSSNKARHASTADTTANVSTLKTHLGHFLRKVKAGAEVTVLDRQLPVAKLIAFSGDNDVLLETAPTLSWAEAIQKLRANDKQKKATKLKHDSLYYLNEDRGS